MVQPPFDPSPRVVLFDLDDTLSEYSAARNARLRIAFSRVVADGVRDPEAIDIDRMIADSIALHPHGADHFGALFKEFGISPPELAHSAADWYRSNRFHGLNLFPEVRGVLKSIRAPARGADSMARTLGIITNGPTDVQRAKIDLLDIDDLIDFAVISEEFGAAKPDPTIFQAALDRAGVPPDRAIFVGDSPEFDMQGARAAGIPAVWVNRSGAAWPDPDWAPDREIQSLDDLMALLAVVR